MKCSCGRKMEKVYFDGKWYWACAACKIWDEVEE